MRGIYTEELRLDFGSWMCADADEYGLKQKTDHSSIGNQIIILKVMLINWQMFSALLTGGCQISKCT